MRLPVAVLMLITLGLLVSAIGCAVEEHACPCGEACECEPCECIGHE